MSFRPPGPQLDNAGCRIPRFSSAFPPIRVSANSSQTPIRLPIRASWAATRGRRYASRAPTRVCPRAFWPRLVWCRPDFWPPRARPGMELGPDPHQLAVSWRQPGLSSPWGRRTAARACRGLQGPRMQDVTRRHSNADAYAPLQAPGRRRVRRTVEPAGSWARGCGGTEGGQTGGQASGVHRNGRTSARTSGRSCPSWIVPPGGVGARRPAACRR